MAVSTVLGSFKGSICVYCGGNACRKSDGKCIGCNDRYHKNKTSPLVNRQKLDDLVAEIKLKRHLEQDYTTYAI